MLKPCPFCGAGHTLIQPSRIWTGMRYETLSVSVEHWCPPTGVANGYIRIKAKTEKEAIERWNERGEKE